MYLEAFLGAAANASSNAPGKRSATASINVTTCVKSFSDLSVPRVRSCDTMSLCTAKRSGTGTRTITTPCGLRTDALETRQSERFPASDIDVFRRMGCCPDAECIEQRP